MNLVAQSDAFLAHITLGLAENSRNAYTQAVRNFTDYFPERDPATIFSKDIGAWMQHLATSKKNKPQYIRYQLMTVRRFFTWLADQKIIHEDHLDIFIPRKLPKLISIPTEKVPITEDQQRHIMAYVRRGDCRHWWTTACLIGWHTGLRLSDIATVEWTQIDWTEEILRATPIKTRRLGKSVSIPMDEELVEHLAALKAQPYYESKWIIPDMAGFYIGENGRQRLTDQFKGIARQAGFPHLSIHCYRHGFVSRLLNAGVEPIIISSMTAQSTQQIEEYAHISDEAKREAMAKARGAMHRAKLRQRGVEPVTYSPNQL